MKGRPGGTPTVGVVYNAWNGFAEGFAATPFSFNNAGNTSPVLYSAYDWLTSQFSTDPRFCDHKHFENGAQTQGHTFGAICREWQCVGGLEGFGAPVSGEMITDGSTGLYTDFENGGSIYYGSTSGTHTVYGLINETYKAWSQDYNGLGLPVSDELPGPPGERVVWFEHGFISATGVATTRRIQRTINRVDMGPTVCVE